MMMFLMYQKLLIEFMYQKLLIEVCALFFQSDYDLDKAECRRFVDFSATIYVKEQKRGEKSGVLCARLAHA
jgi:hypothetical protein